MRCCRCALLQWQQPEQPMLMRCRSILGLGVVVSQEEPRVLMFAGPDHPGDGLVMCLDKDMEDETARWRSRWEAEASRAALAAAVKRRVQLVVLLQQVCRRHNLPEDAVLSVAFRPTSSTASGSPRRG
ncbi:MAG: hypothetical protein EOO40_01500 [Deltaproteobacteria bacterium]|nr:MAG: hypothetical protein EOO40_01500 [Deltaproteobacteria bacterium]